MWSLCHPSAWWGGEVKKKAKLMGRDKGIVTEQQRKQTVKTIILVRTSEYEERLSHRPMPRTLPSSD